MFVILHWGKFLSKGNCMLLHHDLDNSFLFTLDYEAYRCRLRQQLSRSVNPSPCLEMYFRLIKKEELHRPMRVVSSI